MVLLYDVVIRLYLLAIRLGAIFGKKKAQLWISGRRDWRKKITAALSTDEKRIWFHCSSLGEFEQGRPVIEKLRALHPEWKIVLTFFSPSGYEIRKNYSGADYVFYLPADTKSNAEDFISLINPQRVFFTKYDYWYHYFQTLKKRNIPLYMVSSIFRPGDRFFSWYGGFFRRMLSCVNHFFVQDQRSLELMKRQGFSNCTVAGDTRFDRVVELSKSAKEIHLAEKFSAGKMVIVAGSTWPEDESILSGAMNSLKGKLRIILAPHEISEESLVHAEKKFSSFNVQRYSVAKEPELVQCDVLLIDNIGMLSSLYRYGSIAYIGGGFGKGIHNTLEAAVYGVPVLFGPNYEKFNEAKELIECGGAFVIRSAADITSILDKFLEDETARKAAGESASQYVNSKKGATEAIVRTLGF